MTVVYRYKADKILKYLIQHIQCIRKRRLQEFEYFRKPLYIHIVFSS